SLYKYSKTAIVDVLSTYGYDFVRRIGRKRISRLAGINKSSWQSMDFEQFLRFLYELDRKGVNYVLVGGVALNLHGIVRATEDIDVFVQPETHNIERLKSALRSVWNDPDIDRISAEDLAGPYPAIRYGPPGENFAIDLLARLGTAFRFEDIEAETIEVEGVPVRLATPSMLYRMKKDTVRLIDRADAAALQEKFHLQDDENAHTEI
ncbi:MAG: hypothetical protein ETSY2_46500, partial [Candidatus Entotheonella gemina]